MKTIDLRSKYCIENIDSEIQNLEWKKEEWLRKRGWHHSSSHPSSLWLWEKEIGGKKYVLQLSSAIRVQYWIEDFGEPKKDEQ